MDNQRASKNTFKATTFKVEENLRTFQGLHRNFWTFQGKMEFRESSRTSPKIQGLFKTVWTLTVLMNPDILKTSYFATQICVDRGPDSSKRAVSKRCNFRERIHWLRVDGRTIFLKKMQFQKYLDLYWRGLSEGRAPIPSMQLSYI